MQVQTKNLAILFTDIKGFTDQTSHKSRADISKLIDDYHGVVLPVLQARGGRLVKTIGDAFLMLFDSPTDAVLAGVSAQEALAKRNAGVAEDQRIEIRIAINSGEVNLIADDVYGEAVNIASRIEGVAEAGEVYFTEAVYLSMNKSEVPSSEVGQLQLKGIPEKVRVYKVRRETPLGVGEVPPRQAPRAAASYFPPGEKAILVDRPILAAPEGRALRKLLMRRFGAVAIDFMLCSALIEGLVDIGDGHILRKALFPAFWVVYNFVFIAYLHGQTPGKKLLKVHVVSKDGAPADPRQAAIRGAMSVVSGMASLMLGYIWGALDKQGRTWHDMVAGTRVIPA